MVAPEELKLVVQSSSTMNQAARLTSLLGPKLDPLYQDSNCDDNISVDIVAVKLIQLQDAKPETRLSQLIVLSHGE